MIRFITIPEEDVLTDPEAVGNLLLTAVRRTGRLFFQSVIPLGADLLVCFEVRERREGEPFVCRFILSPFRSQSQDQTAAEVQARYSAGENLIASFPVNGNLWGMYAKYRESQSMD